VAQAVRSRSFFSPRNGWRCILLTITQTKMKETILKFLHDERGLTTVEYAVAGGLISAAVVGAFTLLGGSVDRIIRGLEAALP
jgi:pilus assembly protein Flp/PilA